jgi:hypothetical protein
MRSTLLQRSINSISQIDPLIIDNLIVNETAVVHGETTLNGATTINAGLTVTGNVTFDQLLTVETISCTDIFINDDLGINGDIDIVGAGNLTIAQGNLDLTMGNISASGGFLNFSETAIVGSAPPASIRSVQSNTATAIESTDKVLLINTTGAGGPHIITPTNLGSNIYKLTIIMTGFNTGTYTMNCLQGTVTFAGIGDCASFIFYNGSWSLMGAPQGAIVT